jgi:hypothetical protein
LWGSRDKREEDGLYMLLEAGGSLAKKARVILLSNLGYAPAEMVPKVNMHPNSIKK